MSALSALLLFSTLVRAAPAPRLVSTDELAAWLFRENAFPQGVVLLTGTGLIPPDDFTLHPADDIAIEIEHIGVLRNPVA